MIRRLFFNLYYFLNPPWDTGITPPELVGFVENHSPGRALDIGCGTGTNVIMLAKHGWEVIGVDYAYRAIQIGRRKARRAGVQVDLRVGDASRLSGIPGPFELILDIGCLHSLSFEARQVYRQKVYNLLAPGGIFLLYAFLQNQDNPGSPGLVKADLDDLSANLNLVDRSDGTDRGRIQSVWVTYQK